MLPDIRAVIAAIVAAVGLVSAAFGLVATLRVAQQQHSVSFQADLAARGRQPAPAPAPITTPAASSDERIVLIIDTPGPHLAPSPRRAAPVSAAVEKPEALPPAPAITVQTAAFEPPVMAAGSSVDPPQAAPHAVAPQPRPPAEAAPATPPTETAQAAPPSDLPIGGPLLAEPPRRLAEAPQRGAADNAAAERKRAAAEKARKARAARIARQRKAAKRAAQVRAKQRSSPSFGNANALGNGNTFGTINQIGGTFRQ